MGLLDFSYVRRPEKDSTPKTGPTSGSAARPLAYSASASHSGATTARNARYGVFGDAWDWMVETVDGVVELTEAAWTMARDFASYFMNAPQAEQTAFLKELAVFAGSFNPVIGGGIDVYNLVNAPSIRLLQSLETHHKAGTIAVIDRAFDQRRMIAHQHEGLCLCHVFLEVVGETAPGGPALVENGFPSQLQHPFAKELGRQTIKAQIVDFGRLAAFPDDFHGLAR